MVLTKTIPAALSYKLPSISVALSQTFRDPPADPVVQVVRSGYQVRFIQREPAGADAQSPDLVLNVAKLTWEPVAE